MRKTYSPARSVVVGWCRDLRGVCLLTILASLGCVPSAPPPSNVGAGGAGGNAPRDGQAGSGGQAGASIGGTGGAPMGGTGGGAAVDASRPRDGSGARGDVPRAPDGRPSGADTRPLPPADAATPRAPDGPPANPGPGCRPGGAGLDTSTPGLVLDRKTCLFWQRQDPERDVSRCPLMIRDNPSKLCWDEAVKDCQALRLDGKSDWRLPTVAELAGVVVPGNSPAFDKDAFPGAVVSLYWTSQASGGKVSCLDFSNGGMVNPNIGPDGPQAFRCVRGPVSAP